MSPDYIALVLVSKANTNVPNKVLPWLLFDCRFYFKLELNIKARVIFVYKNSMFSATLQFNTHVSSSRKSNSA